MTSHAFQHHRCQNSGSCRKLYLNAGPRPPTYNLSQPFQPLQKRSIFPPEVDSHRYGVQSHALTNGGNEVPRLIILVLGRGQQVA